MDCEGVGDKLVDVVLIWADRFARPSRGALKATPNEPTRRGAKVLHGASPQRITVVLGALVTPRRSPPTEVRSRLGENLTQRLR